MGNAAANHQEPAFPPKPRQNPQPFALHDPHRRPHYHKAGRIRSNLDQFMRRDKDASGERRTPQPTSGRRRHSHIADAPLQPHNIDHEPISLINESLHADQPPLADEDPFPNPASPPPHFSTAKPPKSTAKSASQSLAKQLVRPVVTTKPTKGKTSLSSSASSASTGSSSSTTSSTPSQQRQLTKNKPPGPRLTPPHLLDLDPDDEEDDDAPRCMRRRFADAETAGPHIRFSADAAYPARRKEAPVFARSHSNPAPPTQDPALPKRVQKKRPPPLRTPTDDATGFACGVGLNSGIRRVPLGRTSRDSIEEVVQKDFRNSSAVTFESSESRSTKSPSPVPTPVRVPTRMPAEAKSYASPPEIQKTNSGEAEDISRFDIWSPEHSNNGSSGSFGSKLSRKVVDKDQDLFFFEAASQSSFTDTDSPSRRLARDSVALSNAGGELAEATVQEDQFVFGADGSFNDGGFIISSNGLVEAPERLMRKTSDGVAVEGVPTSSNHIIFVSSLDEFRKSYTFRSSSKDGSSTLGRGSAGRVYLAIHKPSGRKIAVKEINVYDEEKRKQLNRELQTLINHQSRFLVRSFGAFYDGAGVVHVTLEFMDRGSLADIVLQRGRIPEPVVCKLMEHCLRGLAFLHENHILHRDVKTANILLSRKLCRAKLSDFGLARDFESDNKSKTDSFVGTLAYMSPERLHGRIYTYASDIWSLGITVMECVMGKYPFDKPQSYFDIIDAAQSDPAFLVQNEEVSRECVDFIRLCLQLEMRDRPTARELLQHEWIQSRKDDASVLREWLDTLPRLHCEDVEVGSELAFSAIQKQKARLRAKAQDLTCNM